MAVVKSGIFSNPGTGFSTSNRKTNQSPNGARGGASDADFAFVNGKPNNGLAATTSIDPSATRLANAKLGAGGGSWGQQSSSTVADAFGDAVVSWGGAGSGGGAEVPGGNNGDWRVRISVSPSAKILYRAGGDVMYPLLTTDGVIFPHLPTLQISNSAKYNTTQLTHNNYTNYFYQSSEATIHVFRSSTKMFFGDSGEFQGSPPPIVYLDGYGKYYLPHVPCLVTNFSHTMTPDVDYIAANNGQRIPTLSNIQVSLQPVYSRVRQLEFNFDKFAAGQQLDKGFI